MHAWTRTALPPALAGLTGQGLLPQNPAHHDDPSIVMIVRDSSPRAFVVAKRAVNRHCPQRILGFEDHPLPRPEIVHVALPESMAPHGVAPRWRKRHH